MEEKTKKNILQETEEDLILEIDWDARFQKEDMKLQQRRESGEVVAPVNSHFTCVGCDG